MFCKEISDSKQKMQTGCVNKCLVQQEHTHTHTHTISCLFRCKEIFKRHIKKTGFCQHNGGVADNTNYIVVSAYLLTYSMEQSPSWETNQQTLQLVKKFPACYGTRKSLTVPTSACHLSLSWANSIQSPRSPPTTWRSILILSFHLCLGLPNGLFPSGFPTNTLCTPLSSPTRGEC
jgi:hypothetical protein